MSPVLGIVIILACIGFLLWYAYDYGYDKGWNEGHYGTVLTAYEKILAAEEERAEGERQ